MPNATDEAALRETWGAWRMRLRGRLFDPGEPLMADKEAWARADDMYWGLAVGIVPSMELNEDLSPEIVVGEWRGVNPGFLGMALMVRHFHHHGVTTNRSPLNIGWIHVLSQPFQRVVNIDWRGHDEDEDWEIHCTNCAYEFKDGEKHCDCYLCGACCVGECIERERMKRLEILMTGRSYATV